MSIPTRTQNLVPPTISYRDYFARVDTNTFHRRYAAVLAPYAINPAVAATAIPARVARLIYAAAQ